MSRLVAIEDFKDLKIEDRTLFEMIYKNFPPEHSDYSFANLFCWKDYANYRIAVVERHILILSSVGKRKSFLYPVGENSTKLIKKVLELAEMIEAYPLLELVDISSKRFLERHFPSLKLEPFRDCYDYVYLAEDLAHLPGKAYLNHRNLINRFKRRHNYTMEPISEENMKEVTKFLERWCIWRDCEGNPMLEAEKTAVFRAMKFFKELGLEGIAVKVEGECQAISVYEPLNKDTAVVHFEKADPDLKGLYQIVNQETAKILKKRFTYINREQDLGIAGLRKAKTLYRPHHFIEVFNLWSLSEEKNCPKKFGVIPNRD